MGTNTDEGPKGNQRSHCLHSLYVRELLTSWATVNKVTAKDWSQLASLVLENSSQIQWRVLWREEAKAFEL